MTTSFIFDKDAYDIAYLCPHALTHFKISKSSIVDHWLETAKFPFFYIIKSEVRNILFCCSSCHTEVSNILNFYVHPGDFERCFQRYFLDENNLR